MISKLLNFKIETGEYMNLLSYLRDDSTPTEEEVNTITSLFQKYYPGTDDTTAKIFIAVDMLSSRDRSRIDDFSVLNLSSCDIDTLFFIKDIVNGSGDDAKRFADKTLTLMQDDSINFSIRIVLARITLDTISTSWHFGHLRKQAASLSDFLINLGEETIDQYTELTREIRVKCKIQPSRYLDESLE